MDCLRLAMSWLAVLVAVTACGDAGAELSVNVPAVEMRMTPEDIALDESYRGAGSAIRFFSADCAAADCRPVETSQLEVACRDGRCRTVESQVCVRALRTIDLDVAEPEIDAIIGAVETVEIERFRYEVVENTLTVPLPAMRVFFGSGAAVRANEPGVREIGNLDVITAGRVAEPRSVHLSDDGKEALAEYLRVEGRDIRIFACADLELMERDAFPDGGLRLRMELSVMLKGAPPR